MQAPPRAPHVPDACLLVLTSKGSSNALVFENATALRAHAPHVALTLSSHPGYAIVTRRSSGPHNVGHPWMVEELGVGRAHHAATATFSAEGFLTYSHGTAQGKVLDVSMWNYECGNTVNFVGSQKNSKETFKGGGGRNFTLNPDGTMSPSHAPHLVLGLNPPDCTLVNKGVMQALVLTPDAVQALRSGQVAALTLASHPGYAIVPKTDGPRRIDDWHVAYQHLGVGPASTAMKVRQEGPFLLSAHPSTHEFILDVPFGVLKVHCHGEHGPLPIAAINLERGTNKEHHNAARLFQLNNDGTLSPQKAPHLVFGIHGEVVPSAAAAAMAAAVPAMGMSPPVVVATAVVVEGGVPMGVPVGGGASSSSASSSSMAAAAGGAPRTLKEMADHLKEQLGLKGTIKEVVEQSCEQLGIAPKGISLIEQATACCQALG